jgi:hypothetical protein
LIWGDGSVMVLNKGTNKGKDLSIFGGYLRITGDGFGDGFGELRMGILGNPSGPGFVY